MDKTLKRQIGYKAAKSAPKPTEKPSLKQKAENIVGVAKKEVPVISSVTPQDVVDWIIAHPLFKWSGMCRELGMNKGNFAVVIHSRVPKIKPEVLGKIIPVLTEYGFKG